MRLPNVLWLSNIEPGYHLSSMTQPNRIRLTRKSRKSQKTGTLVFLVPVLSNHPHGLFSVTLYSSMADALSRPYPSQNIFTYYAETVS